MFPKQIESVWCANTTQRKTELKIQADIISASLKTQASFMWYSVNFISRFSMYLCSATTHYQYFISYKIDSYIGEGKKSSVNGYEREWLCHYRIIIPNTLTEMKCSYYTEFGHENLD